MVDDAANEAVKPARGRAARWPAAGWPGGSAGSGDEGAKLEETKRVGRVLVILQLIASQPRRWRRRDLSDRFEVSERQIDKDLELIRHGLVLPLRRTPTGYFFESLPHLAAPPLGFHEALALILAARAALSGDGIDSADLAAAISRVEAQLPVPLRGLLADVRRPAPVSPAAQQRTRVLAAVERAIGEGRKVRMVYASAVRGGQATERVVRPYTVMRYIRSWYVIGHCELRGDVRMFKVGRIRSLSQTAEPYAIPGDFDLDSYFGGAWGILRSDSARPEPVVLEFNAEAGRWVCDETWHPAQVVESTPDGGVRFSVDVPVTPELVRWVLGYGARVRVVSPDGLREAVVAEAAAVVRAAGGGIGDGRWAAAAGVGEDARPQLECDGGASAGPESSRLSRLATHNFVQVRENIREFRADDARGDE